MKDYVEHTVRHIVNTGWARIGTMSQTYVDIAFEHYAEHHDAEAKLLPRPTEDEDPTEYIEREKTHFVTAVKSVVFAGLAVESAIYEIAAEQLTDKFTKEHLERLDVFTKWALIPRLICGNALDLGGPGMSMLKELIQVRNILVHHKSSPLPYLGGWLDSNTGRVFGYEEDGLRALDAANKKIDAESQRIIKCATNGIRAIVCLSLELEELLGVSIPALGSYSPGWISLMKERPDSIRNLIDDCKKKIADRRTRRRAK